MLYAFKNAMFLKISDAVSLLLHWISAVFCVWFVAVASDSDDNDDLTTRSAKASADVTAATNFATKLHGARIVKYNFLDLSQYLSTRISVSLTSVFGLYGAV